MKISIIGGGNMGGAIACGLVSGDASEISSVTVIDQNIKIVEILNKINPRIKVAINNYESLNDANIIIIAVKPWLVETVLIENKDKFDFEKQLFISIAAGVSLEQLQTWTIDKAKLYRVIPNTAIAIKQSMTFICPINTRPDNDLLVQNIFEKLGKVEFIKENMVSAATSLSSCGIAYAFRYIRAAMEGGVEMGLPALQSRDILIQTLRGAIELLETNQSHPESEIDKVTTPGGITIKGLNEMEHAGFTSAVIRGLKASNLK
ncbi:MAG: pyrroline-5-carboxylate reductase [Dysgonomonas sp.]